MDAKLSRRALLAATGLGAGSLFLPSLFGRAQNAQAQMMPPRRLVIFATGHGTVYPNWRMHPAGMDLTRAWERPLDALADTDFSEILRPLHSFRRKLLVLDGLAIISAYADVPHNEHEKGRAHGLTGTNVQIVPGATAVATGPSVDQVIAAQIRRMDRLASLELASRGSQDLVYSMDARRITPQGNTRAAFDRLFPSSAPTTMRTDAERVQASQRSVLDFVRSEYDQTAPRLSGEDRRKLELHRDLVRDLEQRIGSTQMVQCERPMLSSNEATFTADVENKMRLLTAALACDLTRVASLQVGQLPNTEFGAPAGDVHQDFAHKDTEMSAAGDNARMQMTAYHRLHARQFATLLTQLDAIPEGTGTLLDRTVVLWVNELATGSHEFSVWPVVMAGGGGVFRMGRYVYWPRETRRPTGGNWLPDAVRLGVPHNKFLVSLLNAFGVAGNRFGQASAPITNGAGGGMIDFTGPLDRLSL